MSMHGEHQHIFGERAFNVGDFIKIGASEYGQILPKSEFERANIGNQLRENVIPVRTMDGSLRSVNCMCVVVIEPQRELERLSTLLRRAEVYLAQPLIQAN